MARIAGIDLPAEKRIEVDARNSCLCRGLRVQITRITPLRRTTLQCSQIFFTDVRTFIVEAPPRYLYRYTIRPRVRSYGDSSTVTLSPGRILM